MSCGCMNSGNRSVFSGIDLCREGISDCCNGLSSIQENNVRNGTDRIRNGIYKCSQGLSIIRRATSGANNCSSSLTRQLRKCCQELNNIRFGRRDIIRNNVENGATDVNSAVCSLGQLVEQINSDFENTNTDCCNNR